ncbi:estradiol 17-beta-dehydrogenase 2, partial [Caerostris extrusa]
VAFQSPCVALRHQQGAVEGFSKYLAIDLDVWGIRVATIAPEMFQTDMTSGENILGVIEQSLKGVDEDVRKDYGDEFLQGFKTCCSKAMTSVSTPRLDNIAKDVESAIALVHPDAGYQSSRNSPLKFLLNTIVAYPTKLQIIAVRAYYFFFWVCLSLREYLRK